MKSPRTAMKTQLRQKEEKKAECNPGEKELGRWQSVGSGVFRILMLFGSLGYTSPSPRFPQLHTCPVFAHRQPTSLCPGLTGLARRLGLP